MSERVCTGCLEPVKATAKAGEDYAYQSSTGLARTAHASLICKACVREIYGVRLSQVVR